MSKVCPKCGHTNESDSNFCRSCGTDLTTPPTVSSKPKNQIEFVGSSPQMQQQDDFLCFGEPSDTRGGAIVGGVFIMVGLFIGFVILVPAFIGEFFGGFGENMGNLGNDFGNAMGNWGETFGESIGFFFEGIFTDNQWWIWIQFLIPVMFIVMGIIVILRSR